MDQTLVKEITYVELDQLELQQKDWVFFDIREEYEFEEGHIPGASHCPMEFVSEQVKTLEKATPIVLYCQSGRRSGPTAVFLERECGFSEVFSLKGGYEAYQSESHES